MGARGRICRRALAPRRSGRMRRRSILRGKLAAAGLQVTEMEEWAGKMVFADVGAIVYYLKATPWLVPEL